MAILHNTTRAFGSPGIPPRWTQSTKDAIGTAYSAGSTVWFTVSAGVVNEAYHPTIDRPQQVAPLRFTFLWMRDRRWEGRDFMIAMERR